MPNVDARKQLARRLLLAALLAGCGAVVVALGLVVLRSADDDETARAEPRTFEERIDRALAEGRTRIEAGIELTDDDKRFLLRAARRVLENRLSGHPRPLSRSSWGAVPPNVASQQAKLFVTLIVNGKTRGCMSGSKGDLLERTITATRRAVADSRFGGVLRKSELPQTRIDITLLLAPQEVNGHSLSLIRREVELGIHGLSLGRGGRRAFFKNSVPVTHALDLRETLRRLGVKAGLGPDAYRRPSTRIWKHPTVHFAESPVDRSPVSVYRCNLLVLQSRVTREECAKALRLCADYMARHVDQAGLLTYEYDARRDHLGDSDGAAALVRRLASTWVLAAAGRSLGRSDCVAAARRSITYLLRRHYRKDEKRNFGYIEFRSAVNVANAAFAVLCLAEIDDPGFHTAERAALLRFILAMEDRKRGWIRPVYRYPPSITTPEGRRRYDEGKEPYYPGEALTALMRLYERTGDQKLLAVAVRVFDEATRVYERTRKKASFTPWMSEAYTAVFLATGERKYADFVFKMNDAVLPQQNGPETKYVDAIGSFFGGHTSSSTGVMVEGMIEAYRAAQALGDTKRAARYRRSVLLGCRFLLQCQYRPENMFFVRNPARALGGMRNSVYDGRVRIDCLQHAARALQRALEFVFR